MKASTLTARLPVLMYHAVQTEESIISISPDLFAWQMEWLSTSGKKVISLGNLARILSLGRGESIPENTIVLTFDDGMESLYRHVYPVLTKYGFTATIFLVSGYCGRNNGWPGQPTGIPEMRLLDWDQIREMDSGGIEFGAHTVNHPFLDTLPVDLAEMEISESKNVIEKNIGHRVDVFAYPYGRYDQRVRDMVSKVYSGACTTYNAYVYVNTDRYAIQRIDVNYYKSPFLFRQLFNEISPLYLRIRRLTRLAIGKVGRRDWY